MLKKRVFKVYSCIRILMVCIILHREAKTLVAGSNSCEVTRSTVQVVDGCPDSEESWREAAVRKKCDVHAKQCSEPERLVYHCVINPYVNQTLELCAYSQNIVGDQGCYQLIKKSTAGTNNSVSTRNPDNVVVFTTTSANVSSNKSTNKHVKMSGEEEIMDSNPIVIGTVVPVLIVAIGLVVFVIRKRNRKKPKRRQSVEIPKAEGEDSLLNA